MTNYEKIMGMDEEKLADFLAEVNNDDFASHMMCSQVCEYRDGDGGCKFDEDVGCVQSALSDKEMIMEWLNINTQEG